MRRARWVQIVGAITLLEGAACARFRHPAPEAPVASARDTETNVASRWHVVFASSDTSAGRAGLDGWASMRSGATRGSTSILLNVTHAAPGSVHPWELHHGRCGADRGIYGPAAAYTPLTVDAEGRGVGQATVRMPLPTQGPFFVRVAASPAAPATTLACGDLVPPTP